MRCKCDTIKGNICKNPSSVEIKNKPICWVYLNQLYLTYTLIIQKSWKGYKSRRIFKNIFKNLPYDLQRKVIFHIREPLLIEKYQHNAIKNVLNNKLITSSFYTRPVGLNGIRSFFDPDIVDSIQIQNNMLPIVNLYRLFGKYISIADKNKISWLLEQSNVLMYVGDMFLYNSDNHEIWMFLNHHLHLFRALTRIEKDTV